MQHDISAVCCSTQALSEGWDSMSENAFIYIVDSTDTIVSVSDNWHSFADGNAWDGSLRPEDVIGHKLWDFIQDPETQH